MTFSTLSKSSKSVEYGTPLELFNKLNDIFEFKLDPCTTKDNPLRTEHYFTVKEDGLKKTWEWNTFINPPFGKNVLQWIAKMTEEARLYPDNYYVMLLPARTDTKWFQDDICNSFGFTYSMIYFIKGRLKFINPQLNQKNEPHIIGSMLWIVRLNRIEIEKLRQLAILVKGVVMN